jgi:hypothetical protein
MSTLAGAPSLLISCVNASMIWAWRCHDDVSLAVSPRRRPPSAPSSSVHVATGLRGVSTPRPGHAANDRGTSEALTLANDQLTKRHAKVTVFRP